ncbi:hypothetical protein [Vibrio hepatarius]|uniref:hypothetical protein n=1 Tax=Vibrio hepatarius TaxID=171383 RepID=UPI001C083670|nr:hypothetical protein [Vibrio hepatarius]MBU2897691.1 hypothetical protein [Vibrio hepatarius]
MQIAEGKKIAVVAPAGGFVKDVPVLVGALVVVPSFKAEVGEVVTCTYKGFYDGPIKEGDSPSFGCEPAYLEAGSFTKTKPAIEGEVEQPIGVFIDGGVLLTGEVITQLVA